MHKLAALLTTLAVGGSATLGSAQTINPVNRQINPLDLVQSQTQGQPQPQPQAQPAQPPRTMQIGPLDNGRTPRQTPIPLQNFGNAVPERENLNLNQPGNMQIGPAQGRPPRNTPLPFDDLGSVPANGLNGNLQNGTSIGSTSSFGNSSFPVYPDPYAYSGYGSYGSSYGNYQDPYTSRAQATGDLIRASGQAEESYSRAAINYQEAYNNYLDNSLKYVDVYWKRKALAQMHFDERYQDIRERRQDYLAYQRKLAAIRPTLAELDPSTGNIQWPTALQAQEYVAYRQRLEELFELRSSTSAGVPGLAGDIVETADAMQEVLKGNITQLQTNHYLDARRFLDGIKNEVRLANLD